MLTATPKEKPRDTEFSRLLASIQMRCFGRVRDLGLEVCGNGLILRGRTTSYYIKQLAQQAVLEDGELPLLANEIEVTCDYNLGGKW